MTIPNNDSTVSTDTSSDAGATAAPDTTTGDQSPEGEDTGAGTDAGAEGESHDTPDSDNSSILNSTIKVGNKEITVDHLVQENEGLRKKYTEGQQTLAEMQSRLAELEKSTKTSEAASAAQAAVADLDPDVQRAVLSTVIPEVEKLLNRREETLTRQQEIDQSIDRLAKKWDGSDGKPHFDAAERADLLMKMSRPGNRVFDPYTYWVTEHYAEIEDWTRKDAIAKHRNVPPKTETPSGGGDKKPPETHKPLTIDEAGERAKTRFS